MAAVSSGQALYRVASDSPQSPEIHFLSLTRDACGTALLDEKYELRPAVKKLDHLRPKVSSSRVSGAPRGVNMTSCVSRLVRNCISCIERYGCTKCPTIGRLLYSFIVLYFVHNYMHTYRIVE